jgi:hypothetical protein
MVSRKSLSRAQDVVLFGAIGRSRLRVQLFGITPEEYFIDSSDTLSWLHSRNRTWPPVFRRGSLGATTLPATPTDSRYGANLLSVALVIHPHLKRKMERSPQSANPRPASVTIIRLTAISFFHRPSLHAWLLACRFCLVVVKH